MFTLFARMDYSVEDICTFPSYITSWYTHLVLSPPCLFIIRGEVLIRVTFDWEQGGTDRW